MSTDPGTSNSQQIIEQKERRKILEEKKKKRYEDDICYLKDFFPSINKDNLIVGTVLKLNNEGEEDDDDKYGNKKAGVFDYEEVTGVYFLDEDTLITEDWDGNIYVVFKDEYGNFVDLVTKNILLLKTYKYNFGSIIHKKQEPKGIPEHLRTLIVINNTDNSIRTINNTNTVINNFNALNISGPNVSKRFLEKNYKLCGMFPLVEMKKHPEWRSKYRHELDVERIQICKSCGNKSRKGCCESYHATNRKILKIVIGLF